MVSFLLQFITPKSAFFEWVVVAGIAALLSIFINGAIYMAGSLIMDKKVKKIGTSGIGEAVYAIIIAVIITLLLSFFNSAFPIPSFAKSDCSILKGSQLQYINPTTANSPTNTICQDIILDPIGGNSIDNGLASSYMIMANLTNQSASNLNSLYVFEGLVGFLSKLTSLTAFCTGFGCYTNGVIPRAEQFTFSYTPLAGYTTIIRATQSLNLQAILIFYIFFFESLAFVFLIYGWPYLLAGGLILRSLIITRKTGGLIIAIGIGAILLYPLLTLLEYYTLNSEITPFGYNSLPLLLIYEAPTSGPDQGNVIIYGANTIGGYVPASSLPYACSSLCSKQYAYEYECGNPASASSVVGRCTCSSANPSNMCPQQSYAIPSSPPANPSQYCPSGYTYNSTSELCVANITVDINFFSFPRADWINNYYGCYTSNLILSEFETASVYLVPLLGAISAMAALFGSFVGTLPIPPTITCTPSKVINNVFALINMYGVMSVEGYIMPLLNLIIVLSAIQSLSAVLGGETSLGLLGRLV
ncbi:MAG: hypothetical protein QXL16_01165 [Candidatus Micrarchaeaceae archaeon]